MDKIYLYIIIIITLLLSGCSLFTPEQAIIPPVHNDVKEISIQGNTPLYSINSNSDRFIDTEFMTDEVLVTVAYKNKSIYLKIYNNGKLIKEREVTKNPVCRIISCNISRILLKVGNSELILFDSQLNKLLDLNENNDNVVLNGILSPKKDILIVSYIYYDNNGSGNNGTMKIFENEKLKYQNDKNIPLLYNFSDDGERFLMLDVYKGAYQKAYIMNTNGTIFKEYDINTDKTPINIKDINMIALLSGDGNNVLLKSNGSTDGKTNILNIFDKNNVNNKLTVNGEKFYINFDGKKIITGNYGVAYIYQDYHFVDSIVVNYGIINDVYFSNNNTYFAVNGTTIPGNNKKNYIGVMDQSGNLIWSSKSYKTIALLKFSKDGNVMLGQSSNEINVYNYKTGKIDTIVKQVNGKYPEEIWKKRVTSHFTNEGIVKVDKNENIYITDDNLIEKLSKNGNRYWINDLGGKINMLEVSDNGESIVTTINKDGTNDVILFDKKGMVVAHKYIRKGHFISSIAISANGDYFAYSVSTPENKEYSSFIDFFNNKGFMIWEQKIRNNDIKNLSIDDKMIRADYKGKSSGYILINFNGRMSINKKSNNDMRYIPVSDNGEFYMAGNLKDGYGLFEQNNKVIIKNILKGIDVTNTVLSKNNDAAILYGMNKSNSSYISFIYKMMFVKRVNLDWIVENAIITPTGDYTAVLCKEYNNILNNANRIILYDKNGREQYNFFYKTSINDISLSDSGKYLYIYSCNGDVLRLKNW